MGLPPKSQKGYKPGKADFKANKFGNNGQSPKPKKDKSFAQWEVKLGYAMKDEDASKSFSQMLDELAMSTAEINADKTYNASMYSNGGWVSAEKCKPIIQEQECSYPEPDINELAKGLTPEEIKDLEYITGKKVSIDTFVETKIATNTVTLNLNGVTTGTVTGFWQQQHKLPEGIIALPDPKLNYKQGDSYNYQGSFYIVLCVEEGTMYLLKGVIHSATEIQTAMQSLKWAAYKAVYGGGVSTKPVEKTIQYNVFENGALGVEPFCFNPKCRYYDAKSDGNKTYIYVKGDNSPSFLEIIDRWHFEGGKFCPACATVLQMMGLEPVPMTTGKKPTKEKPWNPKK
jgi:hypothetical protein